MWVVAYHFLPGPLVMIGAPAMLVAFTRTGYLGVPLFFVLSGFVLRYTYGAGQASGRAGYARFLFNRFSRIYPLYILALLMVVPPRLAVYVPSLADYGTLHQTVVGGITSIFLVQAWVLDAGCMWNCPGWSVSVEAFFYVVFPLLLVSLRWRRSRLTAALCLLAAASTLYAVSPFPRSAVDHTGLALTCLAHLGAFWIGMILGEDRVAYRAQVGRSVNRALFVIGAIMVFLFPSVLPRSPTTYSLMITIGLVPAAALLVATTACLDGAWAKALSGPRLVLLGHSSYAIYILQNPLYSYVVSLPALLSGPWVESNPLVIFVFVLLLLGVSVALHLRFEGPARNWLQAWWKERHPSG